MTYLTIINSLKFAKNLISWIPDQNIDKRNNSWFLGVGNNQSLSPFLPQHIWTSTARGQISNLPSLNLRKVWASYAQPQKRHFNTALWGWEGSCLAQNSGSRGPNDPPSLFPIHCANAMRPQMHLCCETRERVRFKRLESSQGCQRVEYFSWHGGKPMINIMLHRSGSGKSLIPRLCQFPQHCSTGFLQKFDFLVVWTHLLVALRQPWCGITQPQRGTFAELSNSLNHPWNKSSYLIPS